MKVLSWRCKCEPLFCHHVTEKFEGLGYVKLVWKCPRCKQRWIVKGTETSKVASPAKWYPFYGWVEVRL